MKNNYKNWFYDQYRYLKTNSNPDAVFNDNKWINIATIYDRIVAMGSELVEQQPFNIVGNNYGFDKMLDLLARSNYTFDDINDALIDTYRMNMKNAMGRSLVNSQVIMYHCNTNDKKKVIAERGTHYYVIDVPFMQMHFGDRDEFIRQQLQLMHNKRNDFYIDIREFASHPISKILNFSLMCTINGHICNDCKVAIDDKGFIFKIGWPYTVDGDLIIYKFDKSFIYTYEGLTIDNISSGFISYDKLGNLKNNVYNTNEICLLNFYNNNYAKTTTSIPNFGRITKDGIEIINIQNKTLADLSMINTKSVTMSIVVFKYFRSVPNLYPAVNYYDLSYTQKVYTSRYENVVNKNRERILINSSNEVNKLECTTPPISLDRNDNEMFSDVSYSLTSYEDMVKFNDAMLNVGQIILDENITVNTFNNIVYRPLYAISNQLSDIYVKYIRCATLTSLIPNENIQIFNQLINDIKKLCNIISDPSMAKYDTVYQKCQACNLDLYYDNNYIRIIKKITEPFNSKKLNVFKVMNKLKDQFKPLDDFDYTYYNRPVSDQCFITLKYHEDEDCWLFDYPTINHFKGISNTFYIDKNLKGNEIFKFFVLYTDNEDMMDIKRDSNMTLNQVFDFDEFYTEIESHMSYIRYWYAENKLMKLSKILFDKYDDETCINVLSGILKRKIDGGDLLDIYQSDMNYEPSSVSSDLWNSYSENSERAPFSINFLFYTLQMLNGNEDKLQDYFYRYLTNKKFVDRYHDFDISSVINDDTMPIDISQLSVPSTIKSDTQIMKASAFYGLPYLLKNNMGQINPYRLTFNVYNTELEYPAISNETGVDLNVKAKLDPDTPIKHYNYHDRIYLCKLLTMHLCNAYDYINDLQTNYVTSFNQTKTIDIAYETLSKSYNDIDDYIKDKPQILDDPDMFNVIDTIIGTGLQSNALIFNLMQLKSYIYTFMNLRCKSGKFCSIFTIFDNLINIIKSFHNDIGFDISNEPRIHALYDSLNIINTPMSIHSFVRWINDIDYGCLENMTMYMKQMLNVSSSVSPQINYIQQFEEYYEGLKMLVNSRLHIANTIEDTLNNFDNLRETYFNPIIDSINTLINKYVFDLYAINQIIIDNELSFEKNVKFATIKLSTSEKHILPPLPELKQTDSALVELIFQPNVQSNANIVNGFTKICEYVFFDGEPLETLINIYDEDFNILTANIHCTLTFIKVSTSATIDGLFNQLFNSGSKLLDFENVHENNDNVNGIVINDKHANTHFELLIGNRFKQLDHDIEYVLNPKTWLQGSVDRVKMDYQMMNNIILSDIGKSQYGKMYFKPCQIFHIKPNDENIIDSVGGKYFEGQIIYLKSEDGLFVFPAVITKIDHSNKHGFIEAKVDGLNSKWIDINDNELISKYLNENIICEIIDDNISNFMNEYSNESFMHYYDIDKSLIMNKPTFDFDDKYSLPGNPLVVQDNSDYVYKRIHQLYHIDFDGSYKYNMTFINRVQIYDNTDKIVINTLCHDFNTLSLPERYPILRDEPNDHEIWRSELKRFKEVTNQAHTKLLSLERELSLAERSLENAKTYGERDRYNNIIMDLTYKIKKQEDIKTRMELYSRQLEKATKWYNVNKYDDAIVYINNGRADEFSPALISNVRDLIISNNINVFLYDMESKQWLNPEDYSIEIVYDCFNIENVHDSNTNDIIVRMEITPTSTFNSSKGILVYVGYKQSDVYNDIEIDNRQCEVRFKPFLSLNNNSVDNNPYKNLRIRRHYDGHEEYKFTSFNKPNNFPIEESLYILRYKPNGKYTDAPQYRIKDISFDIDGENYDYTKIDKLFIRNPFKDTTSSRKVHYHNYECTINQEIDSYKTNTNVKLIPVKSMRNTSNYDGNISDIMFEGVTGSDNDIQSIIINRSTLPEYVDDTFICYVIQDDMYECCGGLITIKVTSDTKSPYNISNDWLEIDINPYRELPYEFLISFKPNTSSNIKLIIDNRYETIDETIDESIDKPYEYYIDDLNYVKYPISDTRISSCKERLNIDLNENPNVKIVKSPYIGICRYSAQRIDKSGFIDLTGYIPTPLSRNRYEFWMNGRYIHGDDIKIVSPTSIQLLNMKSLHNFEVIELVDDVDTNNELFREGSLYVDLNGNVYPSYIKAMLSNSLIKNQDIRFKFNVFNHNKLHDYSRDIIDNPNNCDIEEDILNYVILDDIDNNDYNKLINIPSINGISLFHPQLSSLGIVEIPANKLYKTLDMVWKKQILTNPKFLMTHKQDSINVNEIKLNVKHPIDGSDNICIFISGCGGIQKFFTLYISNNANDMIYDVNNTVKIIPYILPGIYIMIDKKYKGMYLNSTMPNVKPIQL